MPLSKMKTIWNYCTYNKSFFLLILILFVPFEYFFDIHADSDSIISLLIVLVIGVILCGYGMAITRDRMNNGFRLPKIMIKDILVYGITSYIVYAAYLIVQGLILDLLSSPLNFPEFDLEDLLLELPDTIHTLFSHNPIEAFTFVVLGCIIFYITSFFMEIGLARLADTGSIITAFNLKSIKKDIDIIGWEKYTIDFTNIILAIVFFSALKYIVIPIDILNYAWDVFLDFLVFVAQFWGIGDIYRSIKKKSPIQETSLKMYEDLEKR